MSQSDPVFEYRDHPDHPGWYTWRLRDETRFNSVVMGEMIVRTEGAKCRLRMFPERKHTNLQEMIHGAVTLSLIDIALFAAMRTLTQGDAGPAVTLELSTQFIGAGKVDEPLDSVVEVLRETGRLLFLRGEVVQRDHLVAGFSGLVAQSHAQMSGLLARYRALVEADELRPDAAQEKAAHALDRLQRELEAAPKSGGFLARLFGSRDAQERPRGIYMWGGVGRGKSMLMDLFHDNLGISAKRRVHFHAFMLEVDAMIREERKSESGDPIKPVAAKIAENVRCLAFDEMVVTNTADAAIMSRLFTALIRDEGVTVVTTSNRPPKGLYKDGLNRSLFLPFIDLILAELEIVELNGRTDYRLERLGGLDTWHTPLGEEATAQVREAFFRLTDYKPEDAEHVPSAELDLGGGRRLHVPKSLKGVAVFSFKRLCGENRGASDYLAIAHAYHTVIVVGIPRMGPENRNEAIRFTKLVDALYENRVKLFATADAEPECLYRAGDGAFEFERTVSRLKEMQSAQYMAAGHGEQG